MPQVSASGLTLFLLHMNHFVLGVANEATGLTNRVDDVNVVVVYELLNEYCQFTNDALRKANDCFIKNKLTLNQEKTQYLYAFKCFLCSLKAKFS